VEQKVAKDVDPKSILCLFFKQGMCHKGNKCKFSHDLAVQQKTMKRNLYVDSRDLKKDDNTEENAETNENWDEQQLIEVAEKKHGEKDRKRPNQTDIVCKYFIDAVELNKYGWFWECPNGDTCIYKHALPPGFILKKDKKRLDELSRLEEISLEELIEKERAALSSKNCTKVTLESFIAWKKRKLREKQQKAVAEEKQKRTNFKSGKQAGLSGRDLFTYNPELVGEDDEEANDVQYERDPADGEAEDEVKAFEIDDRTFLALDADGKPIDELDELNDNELYEKTNGQGSSAVMFDENLFDAEEELPDSDEDEEDGSSEDDSVDNSDEKTGDSDAKPSSSGLNAQKAKSGADDVTSGKAVKNQLNI